MELTAEDIKARTLERYNAARIKQRQDPAYRLSRQVEALIEVLVHDLADPTIQRINNLETKTNQQE